MNFQEDSDTDDFLMMVVITWPFWLSGVGIIGYLVYLSNF
jgi:hypothetical protein